MKTTVEGIWFAHKAVSTFHTGNITVFFPAEQFHPNFHDGLQ